MTKPINSTDWIDHTTPDIHANPHDHPCTPNGTGGTPKRDDPQDFKITNEKQLENHNEQLLIKLRCKHFLSTLNWVLRAVDI
jgi:hypothetical protein